MKNFVTSPGFKPVVHVPLVTELIRNTSALRRLLLQTLAAYVTRKKLQRHAKYSEK